MEYCECESCKKNKDFQLPTELINSLINGNVVLFAGAGISTENSSVFKETLYEDIIEDLELSRSDEISFPELMTKFCGKGPNGRKKLLERIKMRFDYCHQFAELYYEASRFHQEIAPLWMLKDIITTNWDDYFERECNAIPFVTAEDFAFYGIEQRKVFKIHGSVSNYGSLIATIEDYRKCYESLSRGLIGANLKMLLATKTVVFVGYSFRDFDFLNIWEFLKREMNGLIPHIYIVTLDEDLSKRIKVQPFTLINTNGRYFFECIKKHFEKKRITIPQEFINRVYAISHLVRTLHNSISGLFQKEKQVTLVYTLFYQDGIQHAVDYLIYHQKSGESFNPYQLIRQIESYKELKKGYVKYHNYQEVAYIDGYIEGLSILLTKDFTEDDIRLFYIFGIGPTNDSGIFYSVIKEHKIYHKNAERMGQKYFKHILETTNDIVPHHRPFL